MARRIGRSGKWGAYLDSTLDRVGDAAIFGGLVLFYADEPGKAYMAGRWPWPASSSAASCRTPRPGPRGSA